MPCNLRPARCLAHLCHLPHVVSLFLALLTSSPFVFDNFQLVDRQSGTCSFIRPHSVWIVCPVQLQAYTMACIFCSNRGRAHTCVQRRQETAGAAGSGSAGGGGGGFRPALGTQQRQETARSGGGGRACAAVERSAPLADEVAPGQGAESATDEI